MDALRDYHEEDRTYTIRINIPGDTAKLAVNRARFCHAYSRLSHVAGGESYIGIAETVEKLPRHTG
jgi:hypothetical protein